jgi:pyruvate dehydrogenase E2 component (dihydrolipoamide acetyltransferase)
VPILSVIGVVGEPGEQIDVTEFLKSERREKSGLDISRILQRLNKKEKVAEGKIKVSGRAKKLANEKGVDLSAIEGSGPQGRITEKDVLTYLKMQYPAPKQSPVKAAPAFTVKTDRGKVIPMTKIRRVIARRMQQSKQTIPHFYVTVSVEMDKSINLRDTLNCVAEPKISINDMIVKASALALEEFYQINCLIQQDSTLYLNEINIGIAVGLNDGLVVPVLPHANKLSLKDIAQQSKELIGIAKAGKQANLEPGSFTVSNMGMLNVENFIAIINPPEAAILAIGSTEKKVVVSPNNDLCIRNVMKMTLSIDHRAADGVLASKFTNKIKYHLQNPKTLLS